MASWVRDTTGRFGTRPYYTAGELDHTCEAMVRAFLESRLGKVRYPLTTDDLLVLVERHTSDLDVYADLSDEGHEVEGVTDFHVGRRPSIAVSETLSTSASRENRYRTTLAHELGHAVFHDEAFQARFASVDLFPGAGGSRIACKRETMLNAPKVDWMEWQASYASGAILMPRGAIADTVRPFIAKIGKLPPFLKGSPDSVRVVESVVDAFAVSRGASATYQAQLP